MHGFRIAPTTVLYGSSQELVIQEISWEVLDLISYCNSFFGLQVEYSLVCIHVYPTVSAYYVMYMDVLGGAQAPKALPLATPLNV